jgi:transposase InsO family protein
MVFVQIDSLAFCASPEALNATIICGSAVLSLRISNTMDSQLVMSVLNDALEKHPHPEIFNTDQGSQYTSEIHTKRLKDLGPKKPSLFLDLILYFLGTHPLVFYMPVFRGIFYGYKTQYNHLHQ